MINSLIKKMTLSGQVTKVTPWMVEGFQPNRSITGIDGYGSETQIDVRYVGYKPDESWDMVLSPNDNLLLKFTILKKVSYLTILFANKPPFIELWNKPLDDSDTWESVIGKLKQRLKKEAAEDARGGSISSLYRRIKPFLK